MSKDTPIKIVNQQNFDTSPQGGHWMILLDGILLIMLGVFLIIPSNDVDSGLIRGLGALLSVAAIAIGAKLWMSSTANRFSPTTWLACIVPFVIGVILLIWPTESLKAIALTVGVVVLMRGIIETSIGLANRHQRWWKIALAHGLITIALGIFFLWFQKDWTAYLLLILLGIDLIARGAATASVAKQLRKQHG
jgi:uncharacterized membrane protein HdeD (DUF308 family)